MRSSHFLHLLHGEKPSTLWKRAMPDRSLDACAGRGITTSRLLHILKRFFEVAANQVDGDSPVQAKRRRQAATHWMRHTHATHELAMGAELVIVRDNSRFSSISTTSTHLHGGDARRSKHIGDAFSNHD